MIIRVVHELCKKTKKKHTHGKKPTMPTTTIEQGSPLYLRDQSGNTRVIPKVNPTTEYRVGRIKIKGSNLVGRLYGETITQNNEDVWIRVQPTVVGDVSDPSESAEAVDPLADEPELDTRIEVTAEASLSSAIASATFSNKTRFSQEKYLRKKHGKYGRELTLLLPTIRLLADEACESNLRWETLGLLARHAAVAADTSCLIYEAETGGLVSAHLRNLGAKIFRITGAKGANSAKAQEALGSYGTLGAALTPVTQIRVGQETPEVTVFVAVDAGNPGTGEAEEWRQVVEGGMDKLSPAGGRFVGYVKDFERANELQRKLRSGAAWVNVTMQEVFVREHQVLENRTHPVMNAVLKIFDGWVVAALKVRRNF